MISIVQALILGLLQGISELFPISSLGHSVILPKLFGWNISQHDPSFLEFLVATHLATATVLFIFFWHDWKKIIIRVFLSLKNREIKESDTYAKLGWLLIIGTIPAGVLGLLFEEFFKSLFATPNATAVFLFLNGLLLLAGELLRRKSKTRSVGQSDEKIAHLTWFQALKVGSLQSIALIPGFSRTGATLVGSLLVGLSHEDALRFSFLLATPIIGAAALLKLPEVLMNPDKTIIPSILIGSAAAALSAYCAVKFLVKYFETESLIPFAIYCLGFGGLTIIYFIR